MVIARVLSVLFYFSFTLYGCFSIPGKDGATHHLILGIGLVSVNEPPAKAVIATDTRVFGISLSDRPGLKLGLGYSSSTVVSVADGAEDVRVEVSRFPGGSLIVDTPSAKLRKETTQKGESNEGNAR